MTRLPFGVLAAALGLAAIAAGPAAAQQGPRTWVSGTGNDSAACSRQAPCRTLAVAYGHTSPFGEIDVVDNGAYGGLTITTPLTILGDGPGRTAISAAIIVNAPGQVVRLKGLEIDGMGTLATGINVVSASIVYLDDLQITGLSGTGQGVLVQTVNQLYVTNTTISEAGLAGLAIAAPGATTTAVALDHVKLLNSKNGLTVSVGASGTVNVAITRSIIAGNTVAGVDATASAAGSTANVTLDRVTLVGNTPGGQVTGAGASIWLNGSLSTANSRTLLQTTNNVGATYSYGNNDIDGNAALGTFVSAPLQ